MLPTIVPAHTVKRRNKVAPVSLSFMPFTPVLLGSMPNWTGRYQKDNLKWAVDVKKAPRGCFSLLRAEGIGNQRLSHWRPVKSAYQRLHDLTSIVPASRIAASRPKSCAVSP